MTVVNMSFLPKEQHDFGLLQIFSDTLPLTSFLKKQKNYTADDIMDYLCTDETYGYGIDQEKYEKGRCA
mgnify:CR=1 FL=1